MRFKITKMMLIEQKEVKYREIKCVNLDNEASDTSKAELVYNNCAILYFEYSKTKVFSHITKLDFSSCRLGDVNLLTMFILSNQNVVELNISGNCNIHKYDFFLNLICLGSNITKLNLSNTALYKIEKLASYLKSSKVIDLNLSDNYISNVQPLFDILPETKIKKLNLFNNNINKAFPEKYKNLSITELNLKTNFLSGNSVKNFYDIPLPFIRSVILRDDDFEWKRNYYGKHAYLCLYFLMPKFKKIHLPNEIVYMLIMHFLDVDKRNNKRIKLF